MEQEGLLGIMPKPVLQALVIADHIYVDKDTNKRIVAGTFNKVWVPEFPAAYQATIWAYIALTEIRGTTKIDLHFRSLETQELLMKCAGIVITTQNPLETAELAVPIPGLPLPARGVYSLDVFTEDGDLLGGWRITAEKLELPEKGN